MSTINVQSATAANANKIQIQPFKTQLPAPKDIEDLKNPSRFHKSKVPTPYVLVTKLTSQATRYDIDAKFGKWGTILGVTFDPTRAVIKFDSVKSAKDAIKSENNTVIKGNTICTLFAAPIDPTPKMSLGMVPRVVTSKASTLQTAVASLADTRRTPSPLATKQGNREWSKRGFHKTRGKPYRINYDPNCRKSPPRRFSPDQRRSSPRRSTNRRSRERRSPHRRSSRERSRSRDRSRSQERGRDRRNRERSRSRSWERRSRSQERNRRSRSRELSRDRYSRERSRERHSRERSRERKSHERSSRDRRSFERGDLKENDDDDKKENKIDPEELLKILSDSLSTGPLNKAFHAYNWSDPRQSLEEIKSKTTPEETYDCLLIVLEGQISICRLLLTPVLTRTCSQTIDVLAKNILNVTHGDDGFDAVYVIRLVRLYSKVIDQRLTIMGMNVNVVFPTNEELVPMIIEDVRAQCRLYAVIVTPENQQLKSVTVNILPLSGVRQEHRNMPLEAAMEMMKRSFESYTLGKPEEAEETQDASTLANPTLSQGDPVNLNLRNPVTADSARQSVSIDVPKPVPPPNAQAYTGLMFSNTRIPYTNVFEPSPAPVLTAPTFSNGRTADVIFSNVGLKLPVKAPSGAVTGRVEGPAPPKVCDPEISVIAVKKPVPVVFAIPGLSYGSDSESEDLYGSSDLNDEAITSSKSSSAAGASGGVGHVTRTPAANYFNTAPSRKSPTVVNDEVTRPSLPPAKGPPKDAREIIQPKDFGGAPTFPITGRSRTEAVEPKQIQSVAQSGQSVDPNKGGVQAAGGPVGGRATPPNAMVVILQQLMEGQACTLRELDLVIGYLQNKRHVLGSEFMTAREKSAAEQVKAAAEQAQTANITAWSSSSTEFVRPSRLLKEDTASPGPVTSSENKFGRSSWQRQEENIRPVGPTCEDSARPASANINDFVRPSSRSNDGFGRPAFYNYVPDSAAGGVEVSPAQSAPPPALSSDSAAVAAVLPMVIDNMSIQKALDSLAQNPNLMKSLAISNSIQTPPAIPPTAAPTLPPTPTPAPTNAIPAQSITPEILKALDTLSQHTNFLKSLGMTGTASSAANPTPSLAVQQQQSIAAVNQSQYDVDDGALRRGALVMSEEERLLEERRIQLLRQRQLYEKELEMEVLLRRRAEYRNQMIAEDMQRMPAVNRPTERPVPMDRVGDHRGEHRPTLADRSGDHRPMMMDLSEQRYVRMDHTGDRRPVPMDHPGDRRPAPMDHPGDRRPVPMDRPGERRPIHGDRLDERRSIPGDRSDERRPFNSDRDYRQPPSKNPRMADVNRDPHLLRRDEPERPRF